MLGGRRWVRHQRSATSRPCGIGRDKESRYSGPQIAPPRSRGLAPGGGWLTGRRYAPATMNALCEPPEGISPTTGNFLTPGSDATACAALLRQRRAKVHSFGRGLTRDLHGRCVARAFGAEHCVAGLTPAASPILDG